MRNLRVAKTANPRRGRTAGTYDSVELDAGHAVPVIRECVRSVPVTKDYLDNDHSFSGEDPRADANPSGVQAETTHGLKEAAPRPIRDRLAEPDPLRSTIKHAGPEHLDGASRGTRFHLIRSDL